MQWVVDTSWLIYQSPCLNSNWFWWEPAIFSEKFIHVKCISHSKPFPQLGSNEIGRSFFSVCFSPFLSTGTTLAFLTFKKKHTGLNTKFKHELKSFGNKTIAYFQLPLFFYITVLINKNWIKKTREDSSLISKGCYKFASIKEMMNTCHLIIFNRAFENRPIRFWFINTIL